VEFLGIYKMTDLYLEEGYSQITN